MPLSLLIGVLTLVPALAALLIAGLGFTRRALAPAVFALAALGALVPAICLLILAPYLGSGEPLRITLFGGSLASSAWFSAVYRADAFGVYAGLGLTFLVIPLLLWLAWKGHLAPSAPDKPTATALANAASGDELSPRTSEAEETADTASDGAALPSRVPLPVTAWAGVALALAAETAALTVLFADNILWLTLAWLVLAALAWGLGELGADEIDRVGLALSLVGPVLWAVALLLGAVPAKSPTLFELMGRGVYTPVQTIVLAVAVALAGGAYPFIAWVRRRAALTTPAGLGALLLVLLPVTLFAAARAYSAFQDATGQWPEIGQAAPPVYGGIALAVLGAVTVGVCGLLALDRRDGRTLLAYLAIAQVGWGMLALSTGEPASVAGIVLLLAGSVFGLGAMLAAAFAGGTLSDDDEPDGAGPHPFGARFSPAGLFAWCVGAVSLIGMPLFGGFATREMISAAALHLGNITAPLTSIAWAGDGLLALALARATAPAFTQLTADEEEEDAEEMLAGIMPGAEPEDLDDETAPDDLEREVDLDSQEDEEDEASEYTGDLARGAPRIRRPLGDIRVLPALIFGLLAVALGIAPQLLLSVGGALAAGTLAQPHVVDAALRSTQIGYATGLGQWLPGIAWGAAVVLALLFIFARPDTLRIPRRPALEGQLPTETVEAGAEEYAPEMVGQAEPMDTWKDLSAVFVSPFTLPAGGWLLADTDMEEEEERETEQAPEAAAPTAQTAETPGDTATEVTEEVPGATTAEVGAESEAEVSGDMPGVSVVAVAEETPLDDMPSAAEGGDSGELSTGEAATPAVASEVVAETTEAAASTTQMAAASEVAEAIEESPVPPASSAKPPAKRAKRAPATSSAKTAATPAQPAAGTKPATTPTTKSGSTTKSTAKSATKPAASKPAAPVSTKGGKSGANKKNTGGRA